MLKAVVEFGDLVLGLGVGPGEAEGEVSRRAFTAIDKTVGEAQDELTVHRLKGD